MMSKITEIRDIISKMDSIPFIIAENDYDDDQPIIRFHGKLDPSQLNRVIDIILTDPFITELFIRIDPWFLIDLVFSQE